MKSSLFPQTPFKRQRPNFVLKLSFLDFFQIGLDSACKNSCWLFGSNTAAPLVKMLNLFWPYLLKFTVS